jgi:type II secretory pathway component GspD/PulD (secretin)
MKIDSIPAGLALALALLVPTAGAQTQPASSTPPPPKPDADTYQTLYLTNLSSQRDLNDILTALRNMLPRAKVYGVTTQNVISMRATPEDMQLAQKLLADLDRVKKLYRLTYTITETDGGKRVETQRFVLMVASGANTDFKQGNRVPLLTGKADAGDSKKESQVQYVDVGLHIEASLDSYLDGVRLHSKIEQSSLAEEKAGTGTQDPVIRQSALEETATLVPGKPLVLGSLDIPGTTRHQEIEVVSELVR